MPAALLALLCVAGLMAAETVPLSAETQLCLGCHQQVNPGLVSDWRRSRHAVTTPAAALARPPAERRMSTATPPAESAEVVVGCYECHGLRTDQHRDTFDHFGLPVQIVVSPADCAVCHPTEVEQFSDSKKAHAHGNLADNPVYSSLVEATLGRRDLTTGHGLLALPASEAVRAETCFACHGTKVEVTGQRVIDSEVGEIELPELSGWPNQGVGRLNPDGSQGACTACHPRHGFAIETARQPFTCAQCHLDPDVPAYPVWRESKHGNIVLSERDRYDWGAVPWTLGEDFAAPSCAVCHNAALQTADGRVLTERTHDFGARLWVRIFGLPTSHPQPVHGATSRLRNASGQPLPVDLAGTPAASGLIDAAEQDRRRAAMQELCGACHSRRWPEQFFERFARTVAETDQMVLTTTALMSRIWERGLADPVVLFDEPVERRWTQQWLIYANSVRYASAMSGPDYATFKSGWWQLNSNLAELAEWLRARTAE